MMKYKCLQDYSTVRWRYNPEIYSSIITVLGKKYEFKFEFVLELLWKMKLAQKRLCDMVLSQYSLLHQQK